MAPPLTVLVCNATFGECDGHITLEGSPALISEGMMFYFRIINWSFICGAISIFGVISNTINMAVFIRTGFKDSINLSLFALAISDFGSCFTLIFCIIAMNPWFRDLDLPFESDEIQYMLAAWPHVAFTKITTLITAFVTVERCLCVSMPLKVKTIITRKRVIAYLMSCYGLIIGLMIPIFYSNRFAWVYNANHNKTMLGLIFTKEREAIETAILPILNAFLSAFAFIFIIVSTIVLVLKLNEKAKWRLTATTKVDGNDNNVETKEQRISKMVVIISTLFIVCFIPTVAMQLTMWVERRVSVVGDFSNLNKVLASFTFIMESVNSAMNVCIYYKNSSNYKAVFDEMFRSKSKSKTKNHLM